jgi:hypothetical protein
MPHSPSYKRILHRMDYYSYLDGLIKRYMFQEGRWDSHIRKCRDFILDAASVCMPERITVLGSGWLLELPLQELAGKTGNIRLLDIIHPPDVLRQTSVMKNVELSECDLTGGIIEEIWNLTRGLPLPKKKLDLSRIPVREFMFNDDPGMVISLNILSQLDALPVKLIREKSKTDEKALYEFRKEIQEKHLSMLSRYKSVLISDYLEEFTGADGQITREDTVFASFPDGVRTDDWTWDFDLAGTDFNHRRSVLKVRAVLSV